MTESLFGPNVTPYTLEQQIVAVYRAWCNEYLKDIERKEGIPAKRIPRPPTTLSFQGGLDFTSWREEELPQVKVIVEPTGQPERDASTDPDENAHSIPEGRGGYTQTFEVQVGCLCSSFGGSEITTEVEPETQARAIASYYGGMSMLLVDQPPALAADIEMVGTPRLSFPNPDNRTTVLSTTTFHLQVTPVKLLSSGPTQPEASESPYYTEPEGPWGTEPVALTHKTTVTDTTPI